ncbi:MAG TPA: methionine synthase [Methanomicrobiales archaeon]|jgi:5-methyltetrahydropteroyltriglutamate--homocysteine methyltransferase|nr:methionine synthase [Methanomicrobiales archaeon]
MILIHKVLPTTVVGSYPVVKSASFRSLLDPLKSAVETAVGDQLNAGVDIISDGQVRGDMITAFASKLPGIRGQQVVGKVLPPDRPITVADTRYAVSRHPWVKGIVTGPSTLAHALQIATPMYRDRADLTLDLAQALAYEARALQDAGVTVIQVDEPIFSTGAADLAVGAQAIQILTSLLQKPVLLHVCGALAGVIDEILKMRVAGFDFEFAGNEVNLQVLSGKDLGDRFLGFGCVNSNDPAVEKVAVIKKRIQAGIEAFGPERLLIDPDCGLRMLTREAAFGKLKAMVDATREARVEFTSATPRDSSWRSRVP